MARGKDARGRFVKRGAGADMAPELVLEKFRNVWQVPVTLGAAGAGGVAPLDTGLRIESLGDQAPMGIKAIMYAAVVGPRDNGAAIAFAAAGAVNAQFQIMRGTRAIGAIQAADGNDVIANGFMSSRSTAESDGAVQPLFALDVLDPEPILAQDVTCLILNSNHARMNTEDWLFQILFGYDPMDESDRTALLQMAIRS